MLKKYLRNPFIVSSLVLFLTVARASAFNPGEVQVNPKFSTSKTVDDTDDPAIWIHPTEPSKSVILGSDKSGGVFVYDLSGKQIQHLPTHTALNNIDVRYGFFLGGKSVDILAGNLRDVGKLALYVFHPDYSNGEVLTTIADQNSSNNDLQKDSYGFALYRRPSDGAMFVFDRPKDGGKVRQYRLQDDGTGKGVTVTPVRDLHYNGGTAEGYVADDQLGFVYITEEAKGIHKYFADPDQSSDPIALFATEDGITSDREGLALYACDDGTGYLVLSNQGADNLKVYERQGANRFVKTIFPTDEGGRVDLGTDGLDVTSAFVPGFPGGFLVAHDQGGMRFHVYDWITIAETDLKICPDGKIAAGAVPAGALQ